MKYAIYDKAADGYLTKLEFENDVPVQTLGLICGYNEYITEAKFLDTKEEAVAVVTRIESNKFMEKGRFVIHSFDEKLADQYIISETGNPTKVVDSITVDLDGSINVKYGTMLTHWSSKFLEYAINRMNRLQEARSQKYSAWYNTFDIYKVITVTDERSCTHYQFINVTTKGLEEYAKNEVDPLNKRIEELEKANYKINKSFAEQAVVCAELLVKNTNLTNKAQKAEKALDDQKKLNDSNKATIAQMVVVKRAMNKELSDAADALKEVNDKNEELANMLKEITSYVADIMLATRTTDHDKMISDLMDVSLKIGVKTMDDGPMYGISVILAMLIRFLKEKGEALELNEKYKNRLNSMYGYYDTDDAAINYCMHDIIITGRCCGKQVMADILSGKKIPISKDKYESILTSLKLIDLSYEGVYGTMIHISPKPKPTWLPGLLTEFKDLTK